MVETTTYSSVDASDGVKGAIISAQRHWDGQKEKALKDELPLITVVEAIISKAKERDPEAKWKFKLGDPDCCWSLHVYSDSFGGVHIEELESIARGFEGEFGLLVELHYLDELEEEPQG